MKKIERRTMLKSMGVLSFGVAAPSMARGEKLAEPDETKKGLFNRLLKRK